MRRGTYLLVAAVALASFAGPLSHALIPHSHDGSEAQTQAMHAALRYEAPILSLFVATITIVLYVAPIGGAVALLLPEYAFLLFLRRGLARHRRFR